MCYVVLQASFRAMENDIVVLLDLLINQEEILGENVKKRKKKKWYPSRKFPFWLSSAFENITNNIFRINFIHWALEVFHFNMKYSICILI